MLRMEKSREICIFSQKLTKMETVVALQSKWYVKRLIVMTYTRSKLANRRLWFTVVADSSVKFGFLPRFRYKRQLPTKQHTL